MSDKKFKRKLTPFLCQEMLYDYAINRLDSDRRSAVEEFLQDDKECRNILEAIKQGLAYADELSATKINPSVEEHLKESENVLSLGRKYSSWKEWPEVIRWSITALVISSVVAVSIALVPWSRLSLFKFRKHSGPANSIEIAQVPNTVPQQIASAKDAQEIEPNADDETSGDDAGDEADAIVAAPANAKTSAIAVGKLATATHSNETESGSGDDVADTHGSVAPVVAAPLAIALKEKPIAPKSSASAEATTAKTMAAEESAGSDGETASAASHAKEAKPKGFVYRAFMTLSNLDEVGPKIADNIRELGGEKAGEVELGWKRGTGRYYHFSLPEESEEKILEELRAYGPVRISKDPHPRVMPKGKIRFILWVESAN